MTGESVEQAAPPQATLADVMRLVQADCERDAARLDSTPFTPRDVGEALGTTLAMLKAVARACEVLAERSDERV